MNQVGPMVSVIMANHNKGKFLSEAIDSALIQSYRNFEIIIIDDASTDCSREIIKKYEQKHADIVKSIFLEERSGPAIARNRGAEESKGNYIAILDSDDKWEKDNLRIKVDFLEKHRNCALIGSCGWRITESGKIFEEWNVLCDFKEIKKSLPIKNAFIHSSVLVRKDVFFEVGMYREDEDGMEDWKMIYRISERYPVINLSEKLCYWRLTFNAVSLSVGLDWAYDINGREKRNMIANNFLEWAYRFYNVAAYAESFQVLIKGLGNKWYGFQLWAFFFSRFLFRPKVLAVILKDRLK